MRTGWLSRQWHPKGRQELITALTTSPARWTSACERQWTTAITAVWSESLWGLRKTVLATNVKESDQAMAADGTTKAFYLHQQGEFQHQNCTVGTVHDSDHEGALRIFVCLSLERVIYIILYYTAQFFPYQECNMYRLYPWPAGCMTRYIPRERSVLEWSRGSAEGEARGTSEAERKHWPFPTDIGSYIPLARDTTNLYHA